MNSPQIHRFFQVLSQELGEKASVFLTGAAAATLWGNVRPSMDIDFAIEVSRKNPEIWKTVDAAVRKTIERTGIHADYAEDIDRWGLISLMDYKKHALTYRHFGLLRVMILEPAYWSIGKMNRYLESDVQDMMKIFKRKKIAARRLCMVWGEALKKSPPSDALAQFKKHVENFLHTQGPKIWGKKFDDKEFLSVFYRAADIRRD